ncbi:MAG: hypothetical protein DMD54_02595 [Gemmatimonadetes bacterium]|nr:MAG: hypothetical protein DMD54_02595 [Gemmatimonadota bacterium]
MGVNELSHDGTPARLTIRAWHGVVFAGLLAAAVAAPSIRNEFVADDQWVVANRQVLEHPPSVGAVLKEPYWPASFGGVMWRPAVISSFAIDYQVSTSPHWFHAMNVVWAAIATALFALLACELAGPVVGLIAGLLFAVHPVHVEAVANVVGRAELMAAAGYAVALVCANRAERDAKYLLGVMLGAALAITAKEIAVTLPAAVLLVYVGRGSGLRPAWRPALAAAGAIAAYFIVHAFVGIRTFYAGGLAVGLEHLGVFERTWAMVRLSPRHRDRTGLGRHYDLAHQQRPLPDRIPDRRAYALSGVLRRRVCAGLSGNVDPLGSAALHTGGCGRRRRGAAHHRSYTNLA